MNVRSAVVHYIKKNMYQPVERIDRATGEIAPSSQLNDLINAVLNTYNTRHARQAGVFHADEKTYPLASELKRMLEGGQSLFDASCNVLGHMEQLMNMTQASTGGHLFFSHYQRDAREFLLVVKLLTEPGQVFRHLASVEDATHLRVERLQVAARINMTGWQDGDQERYVTFVSTREGGHTSNYFREFIGCDITMESRIESKRLVRVVDDFIKEKISASELTEEQAATRKRNVFDHAAEAAAKQEPVSLAEIGAIIWPAESDAFLQFLNAHDEHPSDMFTPDKKSLRPLAEYTFKSKEFRLTMSHGFKVSHNVQIDERRLVIENPPADLVRELNDSP